MFITFLRFSENKSAAADHMAEHNAWIAKGFDDGVFLSAGSLTPSAGGVILAHGEDREAYEQRIAADPFVILGVVVPETHDFDPKRTIPALDFLKAEP